jgi:hypothetical protein
MDLFIVVIAGNSYGCIRFLMNICDWIKCHHMCDRNWSHTMSDKTCD